MKEPKEKKGIKIRIEIWNLKLWLSLAANYSSKNMDEGGVRLWVNKKGNF